MNARILSTTIFAIVLAHLDGTALPRCGVEHDVGHLAQRRVDLGLVLEHVEAGAGDLLLGQRRDQRRLVDDRRRARC